MSCGIDCDLCTVSAVNAQCTVPFSQKMSQTTKELSKRKQRLKKKLLKHLDNHINTVISLTDQRLHGKNADYCFYKLSYPYVQTLYTHANTFVKVTRDPLLFKQLFTYTDPRHLKLDQSFRRDSFFVYICFYFISLWNLMHVHGDVCTICDRQISRR